MGVDGWLLLLCVCLVFLGPVAVVIKYIEWLPAIQWSAIEFGILVFVVVSLFADLLTCGVGAFAGIALWRQDRRGPIVAKIYLAIRPIAVLGLWIAEGILLAPSRPPIYRVISSAVASAIWFAYLERSERVRNTFEPDYYLWVHLKKS